MHRSQNRRPLRLETLEQRTMMAADLSLHNGELKIAGSQQSDQVIVRFANDYLIAKVDGTSHRYQRSSVDSIRFLGRNGNDTFDNRTNLQSKVFGQRGHDRIKGGSADDQLYGGLGRDQIWGRNGDDELHGGDGADRLIGGHGDDRLYGEAGNDRLFGKQDSDVVDGGDGDDQLYGADGVDYLLGGAGNDYLSGGNQNDYLYGSYGDDSIEGGDGDDYLFGQDGDDILWGTAGDDVAYGGAGSDQLIGGEGDDRLSGDAGADELWGSDGNDELHGGDGDDRLHGDAGNDRIFGDLGDDIAWGADGDDTILGGDGDDQLVGGAGRDTLNGQAGADKMWGDSGDDVLIAIDNAFADYAQGGDGRDAIWVDQTGSSLDRMYGNTSSDKVQAVAAFANSADRTLNGDRLTDPTLNDGEVYRRFNNPLFSSSGPRMTDIDQGQLGDCYALAGLGAIAMDSPEVIRQYVVDFGDGTFGVRLGNSFYRVDNDLPASSQSDSTPNYAGLGAENSIWVAIVEKAFAFYRKGQASYASIEGGWAIEINRAFGSTSAGEKNIDAYGSASALANDVVSRWNGYQAVTIGFFGNQKKKAAADGAPIITGHQYVVASYDRDASGAIDTITLYNPWGTDGAGNDGNDDGLVTLTTAQLYALSGRVNWGRVLFDRRVIREEPQHHVAPRRRDVFPHERIQKVTSVASISGNGKSAATRCRPLNSPPAISLGM